MPIDAQAYNPRLGFMYNFFVQGQYIGTVEEVTKATEEGNEVETSPGGVPFVRKTIAGVTFGDIELKKIRLADAADQDLLDWFRQGVDAQTRTIGYRSQYKRIVRLQELANDRTPIENYVWAGCHVKMFSWDALNALDKGSKMVETVTISTEERIYDL